MIKSKNKIIILNIASTIIIQGLAFFAGPIFSGLLGTSNYGIASVYQTWVQLASTIFTLQAAGTIAIARVNFPMKDQNKYQSSTLSLATLFYMIFSVITLIIVALFSKYFNFSLLMIFVGLAHGWGSYCVSFMNSKFTYEFKADKNFILSVTTSVLTIGLSILFINFLPAKDNYWGRIAGQAVTYSIMGIIMYIFVMTSGKTFYCKEYWRFTLPVAVPTVFHILANIVLNQGDKVMLKAMVSNSAVGIYALSYTFGTVINTIYNALNNSWVPFYYEYTRKDLIGEMKRHAKNYIDLFTIITIGFILLSREVFHIYADESFWNGTDIILLFALGHYFVFLYSFPVNYEFYNKKTKAIAIVTMLAAVFNIILNYFLIHLWGISGAVIATVAAHGLQFVFHYIYAKKMGVGEFPFRLADFAPAFLSVCGAVVLYMAVRSLWMVRWGIGAALGIFLLIKIIKRREIF